MKSGNLTITVFAAACIALAGLLCCWWRIAPGELPPPLSDRSEKAPRLSPDPPPHSHDSSLPAFSSPTREFISHEASLAALPPIPPLMKGALPPSVQPPDSFIVPLSQAELPLPVFVLDFTAASGSAEYMEGLKLTESEAAIFKTAGAWFFSGLKAAPVQDEADPDYEAWWNASRTRSEEFLLSMLGSDRVNDLSNRARQ